MNIYYPKTKVTVNVHPSGPELEKMILEVIKNSPTIAGAVK